MTRMLQVLQLVAEVVSGVWRSAAASAWWFCAVGVGRGIRRVAKWQKLEPAGLRRARLVTGGTAKRRTGYCTYGGGRGGAGLRETGNVPVIALTW